MGNNLCCENHVKQNGELCIEISKLHNQQQRQALRLPSKLSIQIKEFIQHNQPFGSYKKYKNLPYRAFGKDAFEGHLDEKGRPSGFGKMYKSNGALFIGNFKEGKANSQAYYIFPDGSYYKGEMNDNIAKTQKGEFHSNEIQYYGGFNYNTFHGQGQQKGKNYQFKGKYNKGKRSKGILKWVETGINQWDYIYEGQFNSNQKFDGKGKIKQPKGTFDGYFSNGQKHGNGTYIFVDNKKYEGQYINGIKQGFGTIFNPNGQIAYSGQWKNGMPHGKGYTNYNNNKVQSTFIEGIDQKQIRN